MTEATNKVGRPPVPVEYRKVTYNNIPYIIGTVKYLEEKVDFVIDYNQDTKPNQMLYGLRYFEVFLVGDNKFLK